MTMESGQNADITYTHVSGKRRVAGGVAALATATAGTRWGMHIVEDGVHGTADIQTMYDVGKMTLAYTASLFSAFKWMKPSKELSEESKADMNRGALIGGVLGMTAIALPNVWVRNSSAEQFAIPPKAPAVSSPGSPETSPAPFTPAETTLAVTTPTGHDCEVVFPFDTPDEVAHNVELVQGGLKDLAISVGKPEFDPGPVDGNQGKHTDAALVAFKTFYEFDPGEQFSPAMCNHVPDLIDGNKQTPVIPLPATG